ncbi:peptide-methionine (S)-S-oxide reductase [Aliidiomarina shirensis]|uniref:Peptide methionine sulfoxide reductase MsrA n=1 Tax=Aliidiomarina shirensis TaxID=1048642 RepID=A0A432WSW4_9GAMM|nr:peptide-methionine (S)-S-oxide reductase MsrA [Aliidiomarina shirensis]RUO36844.1 peptide-methionine (S)-S-oxide reductase [Aliidiomarina shirensis]
MKKIILISVLYTVLTASNALVGAVFGQDTNAEGEKERAVATFAGGCFWCVEEGFEKLSGVHEAISGYTGGRERNPTYEQVAGGRTGHTEAVQVFYDPELIEYAGLLEAFWRFMDPTDAEGQFVDRGQQYRAEIFYHNEEQKALAEASVRKLKATGPFTSSIVTPVTELGRFYKAEEYHQDYYSKNPIRYRFYTRNSGRYQFVEYWWGDDAKQDFQQFTNADLLSEYGEK